VPVEADVRLGQRVSAFAELLRLRWRWRNRWRARTFGVAFAFAAAVSYGLWHIPVQRFDSLEQLVAAQESPSVGAAFAGALQQPVYLRPLRIAQIKLLFDLSQGHYQLAYRGFHVALLALLLLIFTHTLRVESARDWVAAVFALTVLLGIHTFPPMVREAFPINHFLEIAVLCLAALALAQSRGGMWVDIAAAGVFACAALTLESGLLVWVVLAGAWWSGLRGVSLRGLALCTLLLACYAGLRFVYLDTGMPSLIERTSGFLFERLEPEELQRRFGADPTGFYAYNVVASLLSVALAEPRAGVFVATRAWFQQSAASPQVWITVASSVACTGLIGAWAITGWRARPQEADSRAALGRVALLVSVASAASSYAYTKDDIMSTAGVFYALAAFGAMRAALARVAASGRLAAVSLSVLLCLVSCGWAFRVITLDHVLRREVYRTRNDWALTPTLVRNGKRWPTDRRGLALVERLEHDALTAEAPKLLPRWHYRWFEE